MATVGNPGVINFIGSGAWATGLFANELIIFVPNLSDLSANGVAALAAATVFVDPLIGFEIPDNLTMLMAFDNGVDSVVYRYDNVFPFVQAAEFTLLATLSGTAFTNVGDYVFVTG
jgi:hypothetical protein